MSRGQSEDVSDAQCELVTVSQAGYNQKHDLN